MTAARRMPGRHWASRCCRVLTAHRRAVRAAARAAVRVAVRRHRRDTGVGLGPPTSSRRPGIRYRRPAGRRRDDGRSDQAYETFFNCKTRRAASEKYSSTARIRRRRCSAGQDAPAQKSLGAKVRRFTLLSPHIRARHVHAVRRLERAAAEHARAGRDGGRHVEGRGADVLPLVADPGQPRRRSAICQRSPPSPDRPLVRPARLTSGHDRTRQPPGAAPRSAPCSRCCS